VLNSSSIGLRVYHSNELLLLIATGQLIKWSIGLLLFKDFSNEYEQKVPTGQ
jgi:hypothetical protein